MPAFRLLVCGGRTYADADKVHSVLNSYFETHAYKMILIEGGAEGADRLARNWANKLGVPVATVEAQWAWWATFGERKRAGPARNLAMTYLEPHECVAFPGGRGTKSMVELAVEAGIVVELVK